MDWAKKQELGVENYQGQFFGYRIRDLIRAVVDCPE